MSESVYEVAARAIQALRRRSRPVGPKVKVVSLQCPICGQTHRMGLGSPRCVELSPVVAKPSRPEVALHLSIFGRSLAMALLAGCMTLPGCALAPKVDANYRGRVDSFSMPIGVIWTGSVLTIGIAPAWHYRLPVDTAAIPLQHTAK